MMNERQIIKDGLRAAAGVLPLSQIPHAARLAMALVDGGPITGDELRAQIGGKWVLARRTMSIVARYGADVICLSPQKYKEAEMRALEARLGVDTATP